MKNKILISVFTIFLSALYGITGTCQTKGNGGTYQTYDDYVNGNAKLYGTLSTRMHNKIIYIDSTNKKTKILFKEETLWGFTDQLGVTYRLDKNDKNKPYCVVEKGKVCFYVYMPSISFFWDDDFNITKTLLDEGDGLSTKDAFAVSKGINGKIMPCTTENLYMIFADNSKIIDELNAKKIRQGLRTNLSGDFPRILDWARRYNSN